MGFEDPADASAAVVLLLLQALLFLSSRVHEVSALSHQVSDFSILRREFLVRLRPTLLPHQSQRTAVHLVRFIAQTEAFMKVFGLLRIDDRRCQIGSFFDDPGKELERVIPGHFHNGPSRLITADPAHPGKEASDSSRISRKPLMGNRGELLESGPRSHVTGIKPVFADIQTEPTSFMIYFPLL